MTRAITRRRILASAMAGSVAVPALIGSAWAAARREKPNLWFLCTDEEIERAARANIRAVVSPDGWKLCLSDLDKCQLFNLRDDPGETVNLFDSGRHGDVIGRLTGRIQQWQESVDDKVVV